VTAPPRTVPIENARYSSARLQRLAGHHSAAPWRDDCRELAGVLRYFAGYFDGVSRQGCDDCPAQARAVAAHLLAWHDSKGARGAALREVCELLEAPPSALQLGPTWAALAAWRQRYAALARPAV
jgi:hypothetical protein